MDRDVFRRILAPCQAAAVDCGLRICPGLVGALALCASRADVPSGYVTGGRGALGQGRETRIKLALRYTGGDEGAR